MKKSIHDDHEVEYLVPEQFCLLLKDERHLHEGNGNWITGPPRCLTEKSLRYLGGLHTMRTIDLRHFFPFSNLAHYVRLRFGFLPRIDIPAVS